MDGTNPLVFSRVGLINRTHVFAAPVQQYWPRLRYEQGYPKPHFPRMFMTDMCIGDNHITLNKINDWRVTSGEFDPVSLWSGDLKRYTTSNAQATQTLNNLQTGHSYGITLSGQGVVSFSGGNNVQYSWDGGTSISNSRSINNDTAIVEFSNDTPDVISVKLNNNSQTVYSISMSDDSEAEYLSNTDFTNAEEHFYSIEEWYDDSEDNNIVPTDTLGFLKGFNDSLIYSVFE